MAGTLISNTSSSSKDLLCSEVDICSREAALSPNLPDIKATMESLHPQSNPSWEAGDVAGAVRDSSVEEAIVARYVSNHCLRVKPHGNVPSVKVNTFKRFLVRGP